MKQLELTKHFFFGGRAIFTMENLTTGERRTYKIKKSHFNGRDYYNAFFLNGPENTRNYAYIGKINPENGMVSLTERSRIKDEQNPTLKGFRYLMTTLFSQRPERHMLIDDSLEVHHSGRCGCCGKLLTVPESIRCGIGPECARRRGLTF